MTRQTDDAIDALPHLVLFTTNPELIRLCRASASLSAVYRVWIIQRLTQQRIHLLVNLLMHFFQGPHQPGRVWFVRDSHYPERRLRELMRCLYEQTSSILPPVATITLTGRDTGPSIYRKIQQAVLQLTEPHASYDSLSA